jgi:hypothetical protein
MNEQAPSLLVIVPRAESEACRRLQQTLDGASTRVVLDRRTTDRRGRLDPRQPERQPEDRRARADRDASLAAGKWVVVAPDDAGDVDVFDADGRAILFLYCSQHSVPCEQCQETYRLGWLVRTDDRFGCPRCGGDLSRIVVAHAHCCPNWDHRRPGGSKPPVRLDGPAASPRAASA